MPGTGVVPNIDANITIYPTGQKYSVELMFVKFATAKIAKDLNPLIVCPIRC